MDKIIIAHRGASGYEKENTLNSFEKAIELRADMVEFDIRKTGDGKLIVTHDSEIIGSKISEISFEKVLNISESQGFHILQLEELLKSLKGRIKLNIELKEQGYEMEVMELVLNYFSEKEFIVTSFSEKSISDVKKKYSEVNTGLLLGRGEPKDLIRTHFKDIFPFLRAKKLNVDYVVPHWKLARLPFFIKISGFFGLPVIVWTVNERDKMEVFLKHKNVYGIITNYPDLLNL